MDAFSNWNDERRMAVRYALDAIGADESTAYEGNGLRVAIPIGDGERNVRRVAAEHGLQLVWDWQFPLGSDKPPMNLRHNSWSYGGESNCWHYCKLEPKEEV